MPKTYDRYESDSARTTDARASRARASLPVSRIDQWETVSRIPDDDHFGILTLDQFHRRLDAFPLEELFADALRDDVLEILNTRGLDPFAFGFLLLALKHKLHALRFLLRLLLRFDRMFQGIRELQVAQQHILNDDTARRDISGDIFHDLPRDGFACIRIQGRRAVPRGDGADRRSECRLEQHFGVVWTNLLVDLRGALWIEVI